MGKREIAQELAGSQTEAEIFRTLQAGFADQFRAVFADDAAPRTILILPSLSLDREVLAKISGVNQYEQRMLCLLMLLRYPNAHVIYVTSEPIPPSVIDYYLHLLPGVPRNHAYRRLTLLACHDGSDQPLTAKILDRPRLVERIRQAIVDPARAHMTCFNVSALERSLAVRLGIPIYGCDPDLLEIGSKSGSRLAFREAGIAMPDGFENLGDAVSIAEALAALKRRNPEMVRAVVKLNDGFSGEGNAIFDFRDAPDDGDLSRWVFDRLPKLAFIAEGMNWGEFESKINLMGAIVEAFVEGEIKESPSAQYRIDPTGHIDIVSTHDQVTGGPSGQIFKGCRFPADKAYRLDIQDAGLKVAEVLRSKGVLGRFGVDFMSVRKGDRWEHYAIEINLRKGGTTHPFQMLNFLTDGVYDPATGTYRAANGQERFYRASDTLEAPQYRGLTPEDLIDIAVENGLHFHTAVQTGVVFHLIGALSEHGKLGVLCVGDTPAAAEALYNETVAVLDREGARA
ncbi:MAG: carboxylate-amine ligase [Rhodobiaceae bacterium]|nr:carboxylate-amine ligase [Rhodobiaceae bacterium]MCC0057305.1 carboxylate-amine ligase [Rhodobiaceae bacterium]